MLSVTSFRAWEQLVGQKLHQERAAKRRGDMKSQRLVGGVAKLNGWGFSSLATTHLGDSIDISSWDAFGLASSPPLCLPPEDLMTMHMSEWANSKYSCFPETCSGFKLFRVGDLRNSPSFGTEVSEFQSAGPKFDVPAEAFCVRLSY